MREIKFRAWDKRYAEWVNKPEWSVTPDGSFKIRYWSDVQAGMVEPLVEDGRFVVMQFTGLHDLDGNDIYEGDVLRFELTDSDYHGVWADKEVSYRNGMWVASYVRSEKGRLPRGYVASYLVNEIKNWDKDAIFDETGHWTTVKAKVIGNVHENPELLDSPTPASG